PLDAMEASDFWWGTGWDWIRSDPAGAVRLWGRKVALFWSGQELPNHLHFVFLREVAPALWLLPLTFAWVAPAGVWGLARGGRGRGMEPAGGAVLVLLAAVPMVTVIPFFGADRSRAPAVPPLMVAAGFALEGILAGLGSPARRRAAAAALASLAVAGAVISIP